jgi:thioester reductase-like protein
MCDTKNILMTGATGNLGSQILKLILLSNKKNKNFNIFLLIRSEDKIQAKARVNVLLKWLFKKNYDRFLNSSIKILVGDVSCSKFGLTNEDYYFLIQKIDIIYHSAALTRFNDPISKLRQVNVVGAQRIIDFISKSKRSVELHYISTAFIAGNYSGKFNENDFNVGQGFNNPYEQSKFEAENEVRRFTDGKRKIRIYRPSIIVGEHLTGVISDFQMFYKPLYLLSKEVFLEVPVNKYAFLNLIPVDVAAQMIFTLANDPVYDKDSVYHIVSSNAFNISEVIDFASEYFNFDKPKLFKKIVFKNPAFARLYEENIKPFLNYFTFKARFECKRTINKLDKLDFCPPILNKRFLKNIFAYAVKRKYLRINN